MDNDEFNIGSSIVKSPSSQRNPHILDGEPSPLSRTCQLTGRGFTELQAIIATRHVLVRRGRTVPDERAGWDGWDVTSSNI
jgi:hypothetical protein